jgi:hypothetical protein
MLYLDSENFDSVARRLYVNPTTSNWVVDLGSAGRRSAHPRRARWIAPRMRHPRRLPGQRRRCYTQLILDDTLGWKRNRLAQLLKEHPNLVQHRDRLELRWRGKSGEILFYLNNESNSNALGCCYTSRRISVVCRGVVPNLVQHRDRLLKFF